MVTRPRTHCYLGQGARRHCQRADYARARDQRDRVSPRTQTLSAAESEPLSCATCPPLARRARTHPMKGHRMQKKRRSAPERHAIEAALKGEPFPGLVYRRGEFSLAGDMLVLPGIGRIPLPGDIPPKGKIVSVTLQEDRDGWTATVEVEEEGE